jgi:hypothetical protein
MSEPVSAAVTRKGEVVVIDNPAIVSVVDREKGFAAKLGEIAPGIKIVASQSGESKREKAQAVAEDLLQAHPNVTGIFAVNDEMALGALQAVIAAGRQDKVSIIGFDASSEGLKEIAKGNSAFKASVAQDPELIGRIVTRTALAVLKLRQGRQAYSRARRPCGPFQLRQIYQEISEAIGAGVARDEGRCAVSRIAGDHQGAPRRRRRKERHDLFLSGQGSCAAGRERGREVHPGQNH